MSVVGIDVGNESGVVGVARQRGIDVVLNDESKRETPVIVSFGDQQRYLGVAGAASQLMNPKNTVSQVKRLIGRKFRDPLVQKDLHLFPFAVKEGPDGDPLIEVMYLNEKQSFRPVQILAMILGNLKTIAEKNLDTAVKDCVIGIPAYFLDVQRRAYLDAAEIAGLRPLRLMHELTATALSYGIYKTDLPDNEPIIVAFVDIGHASMQVSIVAFKKGQLKVLAHAFDESLGGRDFDEVLFNHFTEEFKAKYKIDARTNVRASLRLRTACEKVKKMLSANPEAPLTIECLMEEKDVKGMVKRDDFEQMAKEVLGRVKGPCERALREANVSLEKIHAVELVGSGSRVPAIMRILTETFGKEPSRTMNSSEAVARGCTLQCAMLSPTFRVREFEVQDIYPFAVALSWKHVSAPEGAEGEESAGGSNQIVFPKGNPLPSTKLLSLFRNEAFTIEAYYGDANDLKHGQHAAIGAFKVGPFPPHKLSVAKPKLKVKVRLNIHGIISAESATLLEGEEGDKKDDVAPMDTEGPSEAEAKDSDVKMDEATANGAAAGKADGPRKKKVVRTDIPVTTIHVGGMSDAERQKATEKEYEMALQDRVMEETKDKKNSVEAYVYDMRNKLNDQLQAYATSEERERFMDQLNKTEDWLYEDGENETKSVYVSKLEELKAVGDPMELRAKEEETRGPALSQLQYCITSFREAASSQDGKYEHIDPVEKFKVIEECNQAESWLRDSMAKQSGLPKTANPVLLSSDIRKKAEALDRFCKPIMTKPRPSAKPTSPSPASANTHPEESGKPGQASDSADNAAQSGAKDSDPMQTE